MLRPSYSLEIGSSSIDPDKGSDLLRLKVDMSMNGLAGSFECSLSIPEGGLGVQKGDPVTVSIGYADDLTDVFNGVVDVVDIGFHSARIFGLNCISKLMRRRADSYYEGQSCGAIVSDLAGTAEVTAGEVEDGLQLPYYAIDSNRTFHDHIMELAKKCGFDVFANSDDELCFKKYESSSAKTFEYGKNIISVRRIEQEPIYKSVKVYGESPSSSEGDDTVHWLTKSPVEGESGSGDGLLVQDPSIKNTEGAGSAAAAIQKRYARSVVTIVDVVGDASVKLNDTVKISELPEPTADGEYQVVRVEHYLSKTGGFTTSLRLQGGSEE